jgi:prephenate dehydrogenase
MQTDEEDADLARLREAIASVDAEIRLLLDRRAQYGREAEKIRGKTGGQYGPASSWSGRALPQPAAEDFPDVPAGDSLNGEPAAGKPVSVCIVGGRGRMGSLFAARFREAGHAVSCLDEGGDARVSEGSRIVLLCVPVSALGRALRDIAPFLRPEQLLMDVTSVKTLPLHWMEESFSGEIVGAHPLFGPAPEPADMKVALVRGRRAGAESRALAQNLFRSMGCATFWTTAAEHDRKAGFAQSLNFIVSAAFFCALARQEGIRPFLTPSFRRAREAARKHLTVDAAMFCEFTALNPEFPEVLSDYRELLAGVAGAGTEGLARLAAEAARWYDAKEDFPAMEKS